MKPGDILNAKVRARILYLDYLVIELSYIENLFMKLKEITDSDQQISSLKSFSFLNELDELIIPNYERDKMITLLRQALDQSNNQTDYYSIYHQCNSCQKWSSGY